MTDDLPYLLAVIAHGKPVFEIGYRMRCPVCEPLRQVAMDGQSLNCNECEGLGHWWITNTGWRARPYWSIAAEELRISNWDEMEPITNVCPPAPEDWPDLFQSYIDRTPKRSEPSALLASLGLGKPKPPSGPRRALK